MNLSSTPSPFLNMSEYYTTPYYHSEEAEETVELIVNVFYGIVGVVGCSFNALMVMLYRTHPRLRKHISFLMLQLFIFCMFQGFVTAVINVIHRELRYDMESWWCAIGYMIIEFFDDFVLVLLALLVIERYIMIKLPLLPSKRVKRWSRIALVVAVFSTAAICLLPFAPFLNIPERFEAHIPNPMLQEKFKKIHDADHCYGALNKTNIASPIITIILEVTCVSTLVGLYVRMYFIVRDRVKRFSSMTQAKETKLKRAAMSVMLVACVFFITILPYGLILQLRVLCNKQDYSNMESCHYISQNLMHAFGILAHVATFVAPLIFTLFNPKLRTVVKAVILRKPHRKDASVEVISKHNVSVVDSKTAYDGKSLAYKTKMSMHEQEIIEVEECPLPTPPPSPTGSTDTI